MIQLIPQFFHIFPEFYSPPLPQYMRLGSIEWVTWSRSKIRPTVTHRNCWKPCDLIARHGYELILSCRTVQIRIGKRKWNISLSCYPFISKKTRPESSCNSLSNDVTYDAAGWELQILHLCFSLWWEFQSFLHSIRNSSSNTSGCRSNEGYIYTIQYDSIPSHWYSRPQRIHILGVSF